MNPLRLILFALNVYGFDTYIHVFIATLSYRIFHHPKKSLLLKYSTSPLPKHLGTTYLLTNSLILYFLKFYINGIKRNVVFSNGFIGLDIYIQESIDLHIARQFIPFYSGILFYLLSSHLLKVMLVASSLGQL